MELQQFHSAHLNSYLIRIQVYYLDRNSMLGYQYGDTTQAKFCDFVMHVSLNIKKYNNLGFSLLLTMIFYGGLFVSLGDFI